MALCASLQIVIRQSRIHQENRFLCGGEAIGRWYRTWRRQSDQLADGCALGATKVDAAGVGVGSGLYSPPFLAAVLLCFELRRENTHCNCQAEDRCEPGL